MAAVRVFARKGYHASRVGDIAEEAGVAYGLLYHYFQSKEDVLLSVFRETWRALIATIRSVEEAGDPPREQLRKVAEILLRSWRRDPDLVRVLVLEVTRSQHLPGEMDEIVASFAAIQEIVERGQADGSIRNDPDARLASYLFYGAVRELLTGWVLGLASGAEGLCGLSVSPIVGPWSDSFHTPLGRRRPFMLVAVGPMAFCLLLIGFMPNLWTTVLLVLAFYFAYYLYEPPYRGLYPDVLPPSAYGRAQGVQHVLRGIALGIALVGGNFLLKVWQPAPFLTAAFVTSAACGATILLVREDGGHGRVFEGFGAYIKQSWHIFWDDGDTRRFLIANSAWEGTFAAARSFVILYVIDGLHESQTVSGENMAAVAGGYVVAALFSGRLGDRFGLARVIFFASRSEEHTSELQSQFHLVCRLLLE